GHVPSPQRIDLYETVSPSGERIMVVRNLDAWNFDLLKPETYQVLAAALKLSHLKAVNLFYFKQGGEFSQRDTNSEQRRIRELAAGAGMRVGPGVYDNVLALLTLAMQ
ncbi:MAG: hypothetical protein ACJ74Y_01365, partial [Bryobacteraceae bacterium]